jgi:hypothetical protein
LKKPETVASNLVLYCEQHILLLDHVGYFVFLFNDSVLAVCAI